MEKRVFFGAIILAAMLFGILFLTIDQPEGEKAATRNAAEGVPDEAHRPSSTAASGEGADASEQEKSAAMAATAQKRDEVSGETVYADKIEKAPPAFGFMGQGAQLQIVGLMSREDSQGALKRYLESLCREFQCSVDVGYQPDISEAPWQQDVVALLKLFVSEGIENGSLFIEANRLKIEGSVAEVKEAVEVQKIVNRLSSEGLKVENHIVMSEDVTREMKQIVAKSSVTTVHKGATLEKSDEKQVAEKSDVSEQNSSVAERSQGEMATASPGPLPVMKKEPQTAEKVPVKKVEQTVKKTEKTVKKTEKSVQKVRKASHVEVAKGTKAVSSPKVAKKQRTKKSKKRAKPVHAKHVRKPQRDIIAPSYMETTFDLTEKIQSDTPDTEKRQRPKGKEDIVAKPKLQILK